MTTKKPTLIETAADRLSDVADALLTNNADQNTSRERKLLGAACCSFRAAKAQVFVSHTLFQHPKTKACISLMQSGRLKVTTPGGVAKYLSTLKAAALLAFWRLRSVETV